MVRTLPRRRQKRRGRRGWAAGTLRQSVLITLAACALVGSPQAASAASPLSWSEAQQISSDKFDRIEGISCPSESFCAAYDFAGAFDSVDVFTSTNPTGGAAVWNTAHTQGSAPYDSLLFGISCPSSSLCVAVGFEEVLFSANPAESPSTWHTVDLDGVVGVGQLVGIDCPSVSLCVAVNYFGDIFTSTNPTGPASAWVRAPEVDPDADLLFGYGTVSCASVTLCVAILHGSGNVLTSTDPTGGVAAWSVTELMPPPTIFPPEGGLGSLSCSPESLCAIVGSDSTSNKIFTSTNPIGGVAAWDEYSLANISGGDISCPADDLCVASGGNDAGQKSIIASTDPTEPASWSNTTLKPPDIFDPIGQVSCASTSLCVAGDSAGSIFVGTPGGGGGIEPGEPDDDSDDEDDSASSGALLPPPAIAPGAPAPRGVGIATNVALVKGPIALLPLRCAGRGPCHGVAKLFIGVNRGNGPANRRGARRSAARKRGKRVLVIGKGRFAVAPGKRGTVRIRLTRAGKRLVRKAGRRGLGARLAGPGLRKRGVKLRKRGQRNSKRRGQSQRRQRLALTLGER